MMEETPKARQLSYQLLSTLFIEGVTAVSYPYIQQIDELAAHLPTPFNPDEAAAEHYHHFYHNIHPYEAIYLDTTGLLGSEQTAKVHHHYQQAGYQAHIAATSPDHIGQELRFLAYLCEAEALACDKGLLALAGQLRRQQYNFFQQHLLCWLLPLEATLHQQAHPFYSTLATLTVSLAQSHYEALQHLIPSNRIAAWEQTLPTPPNLLASDKTSLRDIAHYLLTPVYSGIFLSHDNISQLARQVNLPRGFGKREQMLLNLLRTAVQYDQIPHLLTTLEATLRDWHSSYATYALTTPCLAPFATPWRDRVSKTVEMLHQIQLQAEDTN